MPPPDVDPTRRPWAKHRRRAQLLRGYYPFAAEMLAVYLALLDVWEDGWDLAREDRPQPRELARWAADRMLPPVVKATEAAGPEPLAAAARELLDAGQLEPPLAAWLAGGELPPVERYLAYASLRAPLVALGPEAGEACVEDHSPRGGRRCPRCGGPPQVSFRGPGGDRLVSGARQLGCARCGQTWTYSANACPSCGEAAGSRRTVYAERRDGPVVGRDGSAAEPAGAAGAEGAAQVFPHLRIDACTTCKRYVIDVDLDRDARAVPEVDELAALPLDLYATQHGLTKVTTNLMGF